MTRHSAAPNGDRLLQLSNEVSRIAGDLARMSTTPSPILERGPRSTDRNAPEVAAKSVLAVIKARRLRASFLPEDLFADPAWDMLLDLFYAELTHRQVSVSKLSMGAGVPATTALRWIGTLVDKGLFVRRSDPHDGRRVFVELSPGASDALRTYFAEAVPAHMAS
jgi:DNA-binding MarR family transcriptional regulator